MTKTLKAHLSTLPGGAFIGLAAHLSVIASCGIENASAASLAASVVFCVGLLLIFLTNSKLFTGQIIRYRDCDCFDSVLKVCGSLLLCYIGNLIGSIALVALFYNALPKISGTISLVMANTAAVKLSLSPLQAFLSGIICNICVVGAIALRQRGTHMVASLVPVAAFVMLGAEHIVADFTYICYGLIHKTIEASAVAPFVLCVSIGNFIGGLVIALVCRSCKKKVAGIDFTEVSL